MVSNFNKLLLDDRSKRVLGFLVAKGLLLANSFEGLPSAKFTVEEALWVASNVEPRVLEVLPSTLIHFPSAIKNKRQIPEKLADVVKLIKKGVSEGPSLAGIAYKDMFRWANHPLKDNRTKPASIKRRLKAFKLSPKAIAKLRTLATRKKTSETQIVEELILSI